MIISNVLTRVFQLKFNDMCGTCFTLDHQGRQYLVTAAHVIKGINKNDSIEILHMGKWCNINVTIVGIGEEEIDIAVLSHSTQLSPTYELKTAPVVLLGQDVFFLGYPYGLSMSSNSLNRGFEFPLVKKACVSSLNGKPGEALSMYLDGINNPGFSGGPVVCPPGGLIEPGLSKGSMDFWLVGVISGYRFEWMPTYQRNKQTDIEVKTNTGIIIAYDIKHAIEMIEKNPIGFSLN